MPFLDGVRGDPLNPVVIPQIIISSPENLTCHSENLNLNDVSNTNLAIEDVSYAASFATIIPIEISNNSNAEDTSTSRPNLNQTAHDHRSQQLEQYRNGDFVFIGLDTCANIHSVPDESWLHSVYDSNLKINTSGGDTHALKAGTWSVFASDIQGHLLSLDISDVSVLNNALISVSKFEAAGGIYDNLNWRIHVNGRTFEVFEENGLKGIYVNRRYTSTASTQLMSKRLYDDCYDSLPTETR